MGLPPDQQAAEVFSLLEREIWIITSATHTRRGGLVATWVEQASIDPLNPSLVVAIATNHFTSDLIASCGVFAAHLITAAQQDLVGNFCLGSGRDRDKLAGLATRTAATGAPILQDCRAWLDCRVYDRKTAGDRSYFWADVVAAGCDGGAKPLTDRELFEHATRDQLEQLRASMLADIEIQRPLAEAFRRSLRSS